MAKQIIVLGKSSNGAYDSYNVAFWYPINSGQLVQSAGSAWPNASAAENLAINAGNVKEEVESMQIPVGTATAAIKTVLQSRWTVRNSELNGIGPNQYNGVFFDSVTGWSA